MSEFDTVRFIIELEEGLLLDENAIVDGFQHLIDSGIVWQLQGSYGRMAETLIQAGQCTVAPVPAV